MKKNAYYIIALLAIFSCISCSKKAPIVGLWQVTSVQVGTKKMTPNARWMQFNTDGTQESGNGKLAHSYGTWRFDKNTQRLVVVNLNGLADMNEPFAVHTTAKNMVWERSEGGQNVTVQLQRIDKLPETYSDKITGLWQLEKAEGIGNYFEPNSQTSKKDYLFLRWDKKFVLHSSKGKIYGVYNVHSHKPEIEMIPYGNRLDRDFWKINFNDAKVTLQLLNTDDTVKRTFIRIDKFPEE